MLLIILGTYFSSSENTFLLIYFGFTYSTHLQNYITVNFWLIKITCRFIFSIQVHPLFFMVFPGKPLLCASQYIVIILTSLVTAYTFIQAMKFKVYNLARKLNNKILAL